MAGEEGCARSPEENNREKMANDIRMMEIFVSGRKITCSPSADSQGKVTFDDDIDLCNVRQPLGSGQFLLWLRIIVPPFFVLHSPCFVVHPGNWDLSSGLYPDLLLLPTIYSDSNNKWSDS